MKVGRPRKYAKAGHRKLGELIRETDKAALFDYYGRQLWIPKKTLSRTVEGWTAPGRVIDNAIQWQDNKPKLTRVLIKR